MSHPKMAIIGVGLIGGSIGLALKEAGAEFEIIGHDIDSSAAKRARQIGAIDRAEWNLISAVEGADLVIISIPVLAVKETMQAIADYLKEGAIVTDTTTTKERVLRWADEFLPPTAHFIGGDPIVDEAETGIQAARADLFHGATYCLIPSPRAHPKAVEFVDNLVRALGANPFYLEPAEHDGQMAVAEHLPYLLAAALFRMASRTPAWQDMTKLVSHNFERVTQFPSSEPDTYRDICLTNADSLCRSIDLFIERLKEIRRLLEEEDAAGLEEVFSDPTSARRTWLEGRRADFEALQAALDQVRGWGGFLGPLLPRRRGPKE
jgi:prephenate dehydrogenase